MIKKMLKIDLRKGFDKDFIRESLDLSKEVLNDLQTQDYDLVITDASNRNYDINIKTTSNFIINKIENMLNRCYDYFNNREVESFREILTFEIELFKINNIKDYLYEITFNLWTKQENLSTGTGFANIDVCLANLDDLLKTFNSNLDEFKLNENQLNYITEIYEETNPLYQKLTNIDEWLMQDIENLIDIVLKNCEGENIDFNKELIVNLLKLDNDYLSNLFLNKLNINETEENTIEIYLFDKINKIILNKYDYFEIIKEDYALADIM